jgi:cyclase
MQAVEMAPGIVAFLEVGGGPNSGLVQTPDGPSIVIDTSISPTDMQARLDAVDAKASDVGLVINTHFHTDHTWGNQLFACPLLSHRACLDQMMANLADEWSPEELAAWIKERAKSDPEQAEEAQRKWANLAIVLPTETFEDRYETTIGDVELHVIHFGGHTPGSSVVWLPETRVLFAGDLIFEGRYPFIFHADIPVLIDALKRLPEFGARTIVPGHGAPCGTAEIDALTGYLEESWLRTAGHLAQGHSEDETVADPAYPKYTDLGFERYHEANIKLMYAKLQTAE